MAYNFNNDPLSPPVTSPAPGVSTAHASPDAALSAVPVADAPASSPSATPAAPPSIGHVRFVSCRWQQPADDSSAAFCTHREVKPYAGTTGFDPDAWCGECQYYKLRRAPKKRPPSEEYSY